MGECMPAAPSSINAPPPRQPARMLAPVVFAATLLVIAIMLAGFNGYRRAYAPPGEAKLEDEDLRSTCFLRLAVLTTCEAWILVCLTNACTALVLVLTASLEPP